VRVLAGSRGNEVLLADAEVSLQDLLHAAAHQRGCTVLLTGAQGHAVGTLQLACSTNMLPG
jgi:transcriptional regulator of acetoin/glycerol metabolism